MNAKKVIGFLLLRPAFTGRNLTSLALVAVFFAIYVMAGGKITTVPTMPSGGAFGSVDVKSDEAAEGQAQPSRPNVKSRIDQLFGTGSNGDAAANRSQPTRNAVPEPEAASVESADEAGDGGLDAIEARLKGLNSRRGNAE